MNMKNYPPTMLARTMPINIPNIKAENITLYYSYINILTPWFLVRPIALRHPNS